VGCSEEDTVPLIVDVCDGEALCTGEGDIEVDGDKLAVGNEKKVVGADGDGADGCPVDKNVGDFVCASRIPGGEGGTVEKDGTDCCRMQ
jgi:hypothetical protein